MNASDGSNLTNLTNHSSNDFNSAWSPSLDDTDGDGRIDVVETNTGIFVSRYDTGTDPLNPDSDADGLDDGDDNCVLVANTSQLNSNSPADSYENACDADLDDNGTVDGVDFSEHFLPCFIKGIVQSFPECATSDFDGDDFVTGVDFTEVFLPQFVTGTPGP